LASAVSLAGEITSLVTSAVTSAVFGYAKRWWSKDKEKKKKNNHNSATTPTTTTTTAAASPPPVSLPSISPSTDLPLTRSIRDQPRTVVSISLDPLCSHYAVSCDTLGRILLIDTEQLLICRMWKGYREAQTAFITSTINSQIQLMLVFYAPRRGLLELWSVPQGQRVGALNIGYGCTLLTHTHSCLNPNHKNSNSSNYSSNSHDNIDVSINGFEDFSCSPVYILTSLGHLRRVQIV